MDDQIDAKLRGILIHRCRPGIVDDRQHAKTARLFRDGRDILRFECPAGGAFKINKARARKRVDDGLRVGPIHINGFHSEPLQNRLKQAISVGIEVFDRHDPVAALHKGQHSATNRRHAGRKPARGLCPFEPGNQPLQLADRRVIAPRIDQPIRAPGKNIGDLGIAVEEKGRALKYRRRTGGQGRRIDGADEIWIGRMGCGHAEISVTVDDRRP